jgi:adenylate cyclase
MHGQLLVKAPDGREWTILLERPRTVGSLSENDIQLPYRGVSRRHARFEPCRVGWLVRDLESRYGTQVNDRAVTVAELRPGDRVQMGEVVMQYQGPHQPALRSITILSRHSSPALRTAIPSITAHGLLHEPPAVDIETLRGDNETLRAAHALSVRLAATRDVDALLEAILAFCFDTLPADTGVILLRDGPGGPLTPCASRTRRPGGGEVGVSSSVIKDVVESRQAMLVTDALDDSRMAGRDSVVLEGLRSVLAVPLLVHDEVRGVLVLDSRSLVGAFNDTHLNVLNGIAAQASLGLERSELMGRVAAEAELRGRLGRFLAPELVDQIQRGEVSLEPGGRYTDVAVLFCDIRGFTALSGKLGPGGTLALLNDYFEESVAEVFAHGGMVDKFVGDELMAVWGLPTASPDDAGRALDCALAIRRRMETMSARRRASGAPDFKVGIGVDAGRVVAGMLGATRRLQYTVVGAPVNLASRLCGLARPEGVVVRAELAAACDFKGEPLPPTPIRGFDPAPALVKL